MNVSQTEIHVLLSLHGYGHGVLENVLRADFWKYREYSARIEWGWFRERRQVVRYYSRRTVRASHYTKVFWVRQSTELDTGR